MSHNFTFSHTFNLTGDKFEGIAQEVSTPIFAPDEEVWTTNNDK